MPKVQITFDCANPEILCTFWCAVLGYETQELPEEIMDKIRAELPEDEWDSRAAAIDPEGIGPRLWFQRVPEPKQVKNRLHLDVNVGSERRESEVERLKGLGATEVETRREELAGFVTVFTVMQDPEGNEFCVQ